MSQHHNQLNELTEQEDRINQICPQPPEVASEAQSSSQSNEDEWSDEVFQDNDAPIAITVSEDNQKPSLSKKEKLLAKRAKLDAQIRKEIEKERKERTHRLCLLAGTILKIEKNAHTLSKLIDCRKQYDLNDEEINNFLYCMKEYKD